MSMQSSRLSRDDLISLVPRFVVREGMSAARFARVLTVHLAGFSHRMRHGIKILWSFRQSAQGRFSTSISRQFERTTAVIRNSVAGRIVALPPMPEFRFRNLLSPKRYLPKVSLPKRFELFQISWRPQWEMARSRRALIGTAATLAVVCGAFVLFSREPSQAVQPAPTAPLEEKATEPSKPKAPEWTEIRRPVLQFALDMPQIERASLRQRLFRSAGGAREEILSWGSLSTPTFHAQIVVHHAGESLPNDDGLFIAIARQAATSGLAVTRLATPISLPTKFGDLETADGQLTTENADRACLVFRHRRADSTFALAGWYCGTEEKPAERIALSCFIDRLDLVAAGDDVQLQQIFANAERQRGPCQNNRAASRRLSWLDMDGRPPALKAEMGPPMPSATTENRGRSKRSHKR